MKNYYLGLFENNILVQRFKMKQNFLTIGRNQGLDVVITTETVSAKHAIIIKDEQENETKFILTDKSTNGTYINGNKINKESLEITTETEIVIEGHKFKLIDPGKTENKMTSFIKR